MESTEEIKAMIEESGATEREYKIIALHCAIDTFTKHLRSAEEEQDLQAMCHYYEVVKIYKAILEAVKAN